MRVLILACSARKKPDAGLLPAIERYNGPSFQVLRKFLRSSTEQIRIWILSAEFGLISSDLAIPWYDRRMTLSRAQQLREPVIKCLKDLTRESAASELYIVAGKAYLEAMKNFEKDMPSSLKIATADGGLGRKLSQLRAWLYTPSLSRGPN